MDRERILAFRLARSGLTGDAGSLAGAAACPASDFSRDAALLALAARRRAISREEYDHAVDGGGLVVAHLIRGAIHAVRPEDFALFGRALISDDDEELGRQLGRRMQRLAAEKDFAPTAALSAVAEATKDCLKGGRALSKDELHEELRGRVDEDLMPWCEGCGSFHVAPMLWRYATVAAGVRLDSERRYRMGRPGKRPPGSEAAKRFLHFYGPSTSSEFAEWAGLAGTQARRLWEAARDSFEESGPGEKGAVILREDVDLPGAAEGSSDLRLIPPGDPFLQKPNRTLLAPDAGLRKHLFRPIAGPGVLLVGTRVAGTWRAKAKGKKTAITVEKIGRFKRADLEERAEHIAALRGSTGLELAVT